MATSAFGLRRRLWSSPQQCHIHCFHAIKRYNRVNYNNLLRRVARSSSMSTSNFCCDCFSSFNWQINKNGQQLLQLKVNSKPARKFLHPTRHKIGHFRDVSPSQSLALVWKKLNLIEQKHAFANQKKCSTTQNKHKKLKSPFTTNGLETEWVNSQRKRWVKEKISKEKVKKKG